MNLLTIENRRRFLKGTGLALLMGALPPSRLYASYLASRHGAIYRQLGVRPLINAAGTYTTLTGSVMTPQARQAMEEAARYFVPLVDLQRAVGARIARLMGAEAAMVTSGSAGAIMLATAACVTRGDADKVARVPDTSGMKNEVIMPRAHRMDFDHAARAVGVRIVEVDTIEDVRAALNERTAMLFFVNISETRGQIGRRDFIDAGKQAGVPVFNDAAAELPPAENLSRILAQGFDLVCFSGGKGIRGPQASGILLGRQDLIEAAHKNNNPNPDTLGRAAKVGKEEIMALLAAVETYMARDHEADQRLWRGFLARIAKDVRGVATVETETFVPPARAFPYLRITWNQTQLGLSYEECKNQLSAGEPRIEVNADPEGGLILASLNLSPGEERIVGLRLREVLDDAA